MSFMDRRGSGFNKIINGTNRLFNDDKNYVEFFATQTYFSVVIYNPNYKSGDVNGTVNDTEKIIIKYIIDNNEVIIDKLVELCNKSLRTITRNMKSLQ